jgi:hypothetical protein
MSLELIKESLKVNRVIGEEMAQTIIDNDIIVPDIKPDVGRILLLDGDVYTRNTEAIQDKVLVNGVLQFKILYICDDGEQGIKSINTSSDFSYGLDIPNSRQGMKSRAKCSIEHIDYEIVNSRKINVKTILNVSGKVEEEWEQQLVNHLEDIEDAQVLRNSYAINTYAGSDESVFTVKELLEIPSGKPSIREILRSDVKISGRDYKIIDNKIIAGGQLGISTLYVADDETGSIQFMEHELPFTQTIEFPGIREDMNSNVELMIRDWAFKAEEDSDGELRYLNAEVALGLWAEGFYRRNIELIIDAYSPNARLDIEKESFSFEDMVAESRSQVTLKDNIFIEEGVPEISEVFNIVCRPGIPEYKLEEGRIILEGTVNSKILYLASNAEQPVLCCERDLPFKSVLELEGVKPGMSCKLELKTDHCSYSMNSSKEIGVRVIIGIAARVFKQLVIPVISKVIESPLDDTRLQSQPSITIYFAQPGDTLWEIAKRYLVAVDDVLRLNNLDNADSISPGQHVMIPRRKS